MKKIFFNESITFCSLNTRAEWSLVQALSRLKQRKKNDIKSITTADDVVNTAVRVLFAFSICTTRTRCTRLMFCLTTNSRKFLFAASFTAINNLLSFISVRCYIFLFFFLSLLRKIYSLLV